jgi:glycosyltransferase involved in cell wall biosynthesis
MFPVISETYIGEDIAALESSGAVVTVSALEEAASRADGAPPCRLDVDAAIDEAHPDVALMHWATHAEVNLPLMERHNLPFACRAHTFDVDRDLVGRLLAHPLCIGVFAHPHHLAVLPDGVQPLIPTVGAQTLIPRSPSPRDLVLSVSAGLPKKDFAFLIDVMAQVPEFERMIILARTNGVLDLPRNVEELAGARDPAITVRVNVPRSQAIAEIARASVLIYTLEPTSIMGFPMSIIEAMLCGTIVIAPDRPEAHAIVGEEIRTYRDGDDIVRHVREVAKGGPGIDASRAALRRRAARHRDPTELRRLHDALRDGLTTWKLRATEPGHPDGPPLPPG